MKKTLLLFFIIASFRLSAQTNVYHPFPDSNAHWTESTWWVSWSTPPCVVRDDYTLFLLGDTAIGAKVYHKVYKSGFIGAPPCYPPGYNYYNDYVGAIRQDTLLRRVYYINASGETLLYDFNLNIGDTLPASYNSGNLNYVSDIDSVLVGLNYHKRFLIKPFSGGIPPYGDTNIAIIEGIGSTFGLYNPMTFFVEAGGQLNCFKNSLGTYPDTTSCDFAVGGIETELISYDFSISPNPSMGILKMDAKEKFQYSVYDIYGKEVLALSKIPETHSSFDLSAQPKGIYFVRITIKDKTLFEKIILQ